MTDIARHQLEVVTDRGRSDLKVRVGQPPTLALERGRDAAVVLQ